MKRIVLRKAVTGLLYGCAMFVGALIFIEVCLDNSLTVLPYQYSRGALGSILVGEGVILSSLIYEEDRIPFALRLLIQVILCAGTILVAYVVSGGIPDGSGFGTGVVILCAEMGFGVIIWLINLIYYLREAKSIKRRLKEMSSENSDNDPLAV